jgi:hypothetical protein
VRKEREAAERAKIEEEKKIGIYLINNIVSRV